MDQKTIALLILLTFSLFLFNSVSAIQFYLRPPKMIIRLNTSDAVENSLVIYNNNTISMGINSTIDGNISEVIAIKNPSFKILPNETKTIDFVTSTENPGAYYGQITVTYTSGMIDPVTLSSDITIVATKNPNPKIDIPIIPILVIVIILVVIGVIVWKRGRG